MIHTYCPLFTFYRFRLYHLFILFIYLLIFIQDNICFSILLLAGTIRGKSICRKEEDELRLAIDRTLGSFQPFVSSQLYRYVVCS